MAVLQAGDAFPEMLDAVEPCQGTVPVLGAVGTLPPRYSAFVPLQSHGSRVARPADGGSVDEAQLWTRGTSIALGGRGTAMAAGDITA